MKKALAFVLTLSMILPLALTGCGGTSTSTATGSTASAVASTATSTAASTAGSTAASTVDTGKSISIMVESGSPAESLANETADQFYKETGIKVNIDAISYSGMYDKLSTETKAGTATHDVACMDFVWLPAFADYITPLENADTSDFLPTLADGGTINGKLLGYPTWVNCKILIYRKDLLKQLGYEVPKTEDEYLALAQKISEDGKYKGNALIGKGSDAVCTFCDFACQNGATSLILDKDGNCNLTEEPFVKAMQYMIDLNKYSTGDSTACQSTEVESYFENGDILMELNWSHQYPKAVKALGADKVGCTAMLSGSAGTGATGGPWYECVLKNSANQEAALTYTKWMWDHNADYMTTASSLNIAASSSVYKEYGSKPGFEHLSAVLDTLSGNSLNRPLTPYWSQIEDTLGSYIEGAIEGKYTAEEAMKSASDDITGIMS